ncbi:hypothetical protein HQ560_14525 [bacterium]|nr:hypothetical protein [bacterium]
MPSKSRKAKIEASLGWGFLAVLYGFSLWTVASARPTLDDSTGSLLGWLLLGGVVLPPVGFIALGVFSVFMPDNNDARDYVIGFMMVVPLVFSGGIGLFSLWVGWVLSLSVD